MSADLNKFSGISTSSLAYRYCGLNSVCFSYWCVVGRETKIFPPLLNNPHMVRQIAVPALSRGQALLRPYALRTDGTSKRIGRGRNEMALYCITCEAGENKQHPRKENRR